MHKRLSVLFALALVACGGGNGGGGGDAGLDGGDGGGDAGPATIDTLPHGESLQLAGLTGPVEVVYDDRGIPHIYGSTLHDVFMTQGYLMSRDRFAQMEFIRRNVVGRLSEALAGADPTLPATDEENLVAGYRRNGELVWQHLMASTDPVDVRTRELAQAFVDGVNAYIDATMGASPTENPAVQGAEAFNFIALSPYYGHWRVEDIFSMARFQSASLSYDAGDDTGRSRVVAAIQATFGGATDPRRGIYADLWSDFPARPDFVRSGFPNDPTDTGMRALLPGFGQPASTLPMRTPRLSQLDAVQGFFDRMNGRFMALGLGDEHRGSNNWLVAGSHTASGNPILANDPHLSLISPAIWWYCHLNTAHMHGEANLDVQGVAFAGLPGVVLGFNQHIAWGATTTGYDVTDAYLEEITLGTGGAPDTVTFTPPGSSTPTQVAIVQDMQTFHVAGAADHTFVIERVPHHGIIVPGSRVDVPGMPGHQTAISIRYTGDEPSNELGYFIGLATATSVADAQAAQQYFQVGSQNFIVIDQHSIRWSTQSRIPQRDPRAMTFGYSADGVVTGYSPLFVLPGTGEYEWVGNLDGRYIPFDQDPARGWIGTANADNVGVTMDGNPCNDGHYLGGNFDLGWRVHRIHERLTALVARGNVTTDDMIHLQAETRSSSGETIRDPLVTILGNAATIDPTLTSAQLARLSDAHDRLMAWSLATPHGVGATDANEIADSIATTIFNVSITRILPLALNDELSAMHVGLGSAQGLRWLEWAMATPGMLVTGDALWDDMTTAGTTETRDQIVVRGVLAALDYLDHRLGTDEMQWRWGRLHTVRFDSILPAGGMLSIPPEGDATYPDGFPRHGDFGAVDVGNFGLFGTTDFSHGSGASQRLVVEMTPTGPLAFNALPGGQSIDPTVPHHADEAQHWIRNEQPALAFQEPDVVTHFERRIDVHP
jgi:penicillin amidase